MFRILESTAGENVDAMYTAGSAMVAGMGVVKGTGFEVDFPSSATAADIFFVTKETVPTDLDMLNGKGSAYDLDDIADGEAVILVKPRIGDTVWTDQSDTVAVGDYVVVGTDGKFETGASAAKSNLKVKSITLNDAGTHTGVTIEVVDWATIA